MLRYLVGHDGARSHDANVTEALAAADAPKAGEAVEHHHHRLRPVVVHGGQVVVPGAGERRLAGPRGDLRLVPERNLQKAKYG